MTQPPPPSSWQRASTPGGGLLRLFSSDPGLRGREIMRGTCAACGVVHRGLHACILPAHGGLGPTGTCLGLAAVGRVADGAR